MEYLNKHLQSLGATNHTIRAMSIDGSGTIVSAIFTVKGRGKWYFYRSELNTMGIK